MASLRLVGLEKRFPGGGLAVDRVDLEVADGELLVLVGPSGCGKSTTMRMVAGLDTPSAGRIFIDDRDVTELPPQERDVAMVFQSYALYPHKTVRDNLAFGLKVRGTPRAEIDRRVAEVAGQLELEPLLARKPAQLSGGQRQRVALGRAIVRSPRLFLLDEPLSNLDAMLRVQTRGELARLQTRLGATMLYVTHDQEEAMTLADRVAVMRAGKIEQLGPPLEVYARPASTFVASFLGAPAMNLLPGPRLGESSEVILGIRPHEIELGEAGAHRGEVELVEALGREQLVHVSLGDEVRVRVLVPAEARISAGETLGLSFAPDRLHRFEASSGRRL